MPSDIEGGSDTAFVSLNLPPVRTPTARRPLKGCYVYAHLRPDRTPFCIGKGTGYRAWSTDRDAQWWHFVRTRCDGVYEIAIVAEKLGVLAPLLETARRDRYPHDWLVAARLCRTHHDHPREIALLEEFLSGPRVNGPAWLELEERLFELPR